MDGNKKGAELREQSNTNQTTRLRREVQDDFNTILQQAKERFTDDIWQGAEAIINRSDIAQAFEQTEQAAYDALAAGTLTANDLGALVGACAIYWGAVGKLCIESRM